MNDNRTPKQEADLIVELLDYLSADRVIVYGISAGGPTAIELVANYPNRVIKLILASAVSKKWLDENGEVYKTAQRLFIPKVEKYIWGVVRFFSKIFPNMIGKSFYPQFLNLPINRLKKADIKDLLNAMKHYSSGYGFLNDINQTIKVGEFANIYYS